MSAHTPITRAKVSPWEARFRAALNSQNEGFLLRKLAAEMQAEGEQIWATLFDLANGEFDDDRSEALAEIEYRFAEWAAEEDYASASYRYECETGRDADRSTSPYWDKPDWIRNRVTDMMAEGVA